MSEKTNIPWCDSTINFWEGCSKVSPGCEHCYAEQRDKRHLYGPQEHWGKGKPRRKVLGAVKQALALSRKPWMCDQCHTEWADSPELWSHHLACPQCRSVLRRRRIFSLSLGDWLDPEVPIEWLAEMLDTIRRCDQCTWILCTKRPELWYSRISEALDHVEGLKQEDPHDHDPNTDLGWWLNLWTGDEAPKNLWLLVTAENQQMADKRIPELLKIPAVVHGLSCEPLLGHLILPTCTGDADCPFEHDGHSDKPFGGLDWVICGGESGKEARPCNRDWVRSLVQQCQAASVACFVKQMGSNTVATLGPVSGEPGHIGDIIQLPMKHPKGGNPEEWPHDLQVRQFPTT